MSLNIFCLFNLGGLVVKLLYTSNSSWALIFSASLAPGFLSLANASDFSFLIIFAIIGLGDLAPNIISFLPSEYSTIALFVSLGNTSFIFPAGPNSIVPMVFASKSSSFSLANISSTVFSNLFTVFSDKSSLVWAVSLLLLGVNKGEEISTETASEGGRSPCCCSLSTLSTSKETSLNIFLYLGIWKTFINCFVKLPKIYDVIVASLTWPLAIPYKRLNLSVPEVSRRFLFLNSTAASSLERLFSLT